MIASDPGVRVALHDLGGSGPPLLIVHCTGFHGHAYQPIAAHLVDDFHVHAVDLRGHGDSEIQPGTTFDWAGLSRDVLAVIEHFDRDGPVRAVGHSMGGASIILAELTRPGSIRSAWLFEPIVVPAELRSRLSGNPFAGVARRRREVFASREEAIGRYTGRPPFENFDPAVIRAYVDHGFDDQPDGTVRLKCRAENEARVFEGSFHQAFEELAAIEVPVTVIGSGDGQPPARLAEPIAAALPHGRYEHWADHTHFGPFEDPAAVADAIRARLV